MSLSPEFFRFDALANFIGAFVVIFTLLTVVYSLDYMKKKQGLIGYYLSILLTLVASLGAVFANNLILFMVFWGFLGFLLYLLISFGEKETTTATAKKAFIIIGGTDAVMLLGLALVWRLSGSLQMSHILIPLDTKLAVWAYLCLAIGAFAKAGAMPFHTWIPDTAEDSPTPVTAFLPASLDKLLGIYFLARISLNMFDMSQEMNSVLMALGSITIVAAVMMALIQHDLKRLLGYHAVSQVGYMVLGIGTGTALGIAGGLFHMLNHAIYKSCLFFSGGSVERAAGTTDLEKLGGLAKFMPITFSTFLIASFAISGLPPFNGFASKWMVYQGILETAKDGGYLWVIWLVSAMFGSALTLASFMKLVHAVFLGQPARKSAASAGKVEEVGPLMWVPQAILAVFCVIFGVFAYRIPLKLFIAPSVGEVFSFSGIWSSSLATLLILAAIALGGLIYLVGTLSKAREAEAFMGGESLKDIPQMRVSGVEFYKTIKDMPILSFFYLLAEKKVFDIYDLGVKATFGFNRGLSYLHNGVLPTYLAWCLLGMGFIFYLLFK